MIGILNEIGKCSVMEKYEAKTKVPRISRQASTVRIMIGNKKRIAACEIFHLFG